LGTFDEVGCPTYRQLQVVCMDGCHVAHGVGDY
jgi:hypothetical protein